MDKQPPRIPAPPRIPSPLPMDLEGTVKLGIKTLLALLCAIVAGVATAMTLFATLETKNGTKESVLTHNTSDQAHPTVVTSIKKIEDKVALSEVKLQRLNEKQNETREDVIYIRDRIDFLTEQNVRETAAQRAPEGRSRSAGERAVQRLRASGDPEQALSE